MCMKLESTVWPYEQDKVVFYKLFSFNTVSNKYTESPCYEFMWEQGINKSFIDNYHIIQEILEGRVRHGFHVFINKKDAEYVRDFMFARNNRLIEVVGKKEDFIGIGLWSDNEKTQQAVFKNLEITLEEWNKLCA